jgi:hypothetical protein
MPGKMPSFWQGINHEHAGRSFHSANMTVSIPISFMEAAS